jgi:hypothetical protein
MSSKNLGKSRSYYSTPIPGRGYIPFTNKTVDVPVESLKSYSFVKLVDYHNRDYALFKDSSGGEMMQSLQSIRFMRCKPGEDNYSAKLSNEQAISIYHRANAGEKTAALAAEFNIGTGVISAIKSLRAWRGTILASINGVTKQKPAKATVASRARGKKLSPSLANFIRKDHAVMKLPVKVLAKKYCVSQRTIQRILKGDMWQQKG